MARMPKSGDKAPDFEAETYEGKKVKLSDFKNKKTVALYFYPKDNTPGCTKEACSMRDGMKELEKLGIQVLGVSTDSVRSHEGFRDKYTLNFHLFSDKRRNIETASLAWSLKQSGKKVAVMKPVQTGTDSGGCLDIVFVQSVIETNYLLDEVCPYRFPQSLAPLVAANIAGEKIDLERIKSCFYKLSSIHDTVIVEGAGGLLSPITDAYLMSDLAFNLGLSLIIVTR